MLQPLPGDGMGVGVQMTGLQQFTDHIAKAARRVEMVHAGQAATWRNRAGGFETRSQPGNSKQKNEQGRLAEGRAIGASTRQFRNEG